MTDYDLNETVSIGKKLHLPVVISERCVRFRLKQAQRARSLFRQAMGSKTVEGEEEGQTCILTGGACERPHSLIFLSLEGRGQR